MKTFEEKIVEPISQLTDIFEQMTDLVLEAFNDTTPEEFSPNQIASTSSPIFDHVSTPEDTSFISVTNELTKLISKAISPIQLLGQFSPPSSQKEILVGAYSPHKIRKLQNLAFKWNSQLAVVSRILKSEFSDSPPQENAQLMMQTLKNSANSMASSINKVLKQHNDRNATDKQNQVDYFEEFK